MTASSRPLRVSFVEPSGLLYGSELALLDILENVEASRIQPEVILPTDAPFTALLRERQIEAMELLPALRCGGRWRKLRSYVLLALHWARLRPDVIYVNQAGILRPIAMLARMLGLPIVCQVQTVEDAKWIGSLEGLRNRVVTFICNSKYTAGFVGVPLDRLSIFYQGYRAKGLRRDRHRTRVERVGILGRISEGKGHYLLIEAIARLKQTSKPLPQFTFIGSPADQAEEDRLHAEIARYGLSHHVELRGHRTDIGAELERLDLLAIPSRGEPLGRILFEAAEALVPVLVADSGGLGEVSELFGIGVRFRSGDVNDLVAKLRSVFGTYTAVQEQFERDADRMLRSLALAPYIESITTLIERAAHGLSSEVRWFGVDTAAKR